MSRNTDKNVYKNLCEPNFISADMLILALNYATYYE